jgi:hypothetical protein
VRIRGYSWVTAYSASLLGIASEINKRKVRIFLWRYSGSQDGQALKKGLGPGTGLSLARDLLPHRGAGLSLTSVADRVIARLTLEAPVVSLKACPVAQDGSEPKRLM